MLSFTDQNAVDLHRAGLTLTYATTVEGKHTDLVKNISLYGGITFPFVAVC
jgi:hypothetical protein